MFTEKQEELIQNITNDSKAGELIVESLMRHVEKNPHKIIGMQQTIISLTTILLKKMENQINVSHEGLRYAIGEFYWKNKNYIVKNNASFVVAVKICKELFPDGDISFGNGYEKRYFNSMLIYLQEHRNEYVDSDWATLYNYNSYFEMILNQ